MRLSLSLRCHGMTAVAARTWRAHRREAWRGCCVVTGVLLAGTLLAAALLGPGGTPAARHGTKRGVINAIGAENEYANVLGQIGGKYVKVSSILNNPNTDPHTFEASTSVAEEVSQRRADRAERRRLRRLHERHRVRLAELRAARSSSSSTSWDSPTARPNPHLWYNPKTMPAVAKVMATDLSELDPSHKSYFEANDCSPSTPR